jgi:nucleoside-diphosphate-sugar epimerase
MKVFLTGATGYIGSEVAKALRRAGHEVWGLVRNPERAGDLYRSEVRTVIGTIQQSGKYIGKTRECDVLVHAAADSEAGMASTDPEVIKTFLQASEGKSKTIIYTSGVWVYGNTSKEGVDETTPLNPPKHVAWRPAVEQMVLSASGVRAIVVRPGCVYGKRGGLTSTWFEGAEKSEIKIIGDGTNHWAMVHVDDVADAYVRIVESKADGIFNLTDRTRHSVSVMAKATFRAVHQEGSFRFVLLEQAEKTMSTFAECLTLDQHVISAKANRVLGWNARHAGFVEDVEGYYLAWKETNK